MRVFSFVAFGTLAACSADMQSADVLSSRISQAPTSELCAAYPLSGTTARGKLMIEAELASRGIRQCPTGNYGQASASSLGVNLYDRSFTTARVSPTVDYNCADFPSGSAAQKFFLASGGPLSDLHNLDGDGDGLACEWGAEIKRISTYRRPASVQRVTTSRCYTGPRGGTYTITSGGNRNYSGC